MSALKHTIVVRNPDSGAAVALLAGEPVPDWATDLVQADDYEADEQEEVAYSDLKVDALRNLVAERNEARKDDEQIQVGGKGTKADLIAALEADDAAADDAGE